MVALWFKLQKGGLFFVLCEDNGVWEIKGQHEVMMGNVEESLK